MSTTISTFAQNILEHKYAMELPDGSRESWGDISRRVATAVMGKYLPALIPDVIELIESRKFLPAGRYLYASGRKLHQVNNCLLMDVEDSKEGWAKLLHNVALGLMTGAGVGVNYSKLREYGAPIGGLGGIASGPIALMQMINEVGRHIMQGGSRRCLPENSLIQTKRGLLQIRNVKLGDMVQTADGYYPVTNVFEQGVQQVLNIRTEVSNFYCTPNHTVAVYEDKETYTWKRADQLEEKDRLIFVAEALVTDNEEPDQMNEELAWLLGFLQKRAIKPTGIFTHKLDDRTEKIRYLIGKYSLEVFNHQIVYQKDDFLRKYMDAYFQYGEVPSFVMTGSSRVKASFIAGLLDCDGNTSIEPLTILICKNVNYARQLQAVLFSLGILATVKPILRSNSIKVFVRQKFRVLLKEAVSEFLTTEIAVFDRAHKLPRKKLFPLRILSVTAGELVHTIDIEVADRHEFIADGLLTHNSALLASLHWDHPDINEFIQSKNWSEDLRRQKETDFNFPAPLDGTNISIILDDSFFDAFDNPTHLLYTSAQDLYWKVVKRMCKTGEPGFLIAHGENQGEYLTNACGEVTSRDNNDICNLGSLNMARITDKEDMRTSVELAIAFLLCGSLYSALPYAEVGPIREKNRRLGLGMLGLHEWLLMRGKPYGPDEELSEWLKIYTESDIFAKKYANALGISTPVKTRSIAPAGTISIVGETTSGIEPVFCTAFKRRYLKGRNWYAQYVVDATAQRLIKNGVNPESIEDAYKLSTQVERRIDFQVFLQKYVSHSISSTVNLPTWGSKENNPDTVESFGKILVGKLPLLRGITVYPDGARGGQPLVPVAYSEAILKSGHEFEEYGNNHSCVNGVCGI